MDVRVVVTVMIALSTIFNLSAQDTEREIDSLKTLLVGLSGGQRVNVLYDLSF